MTRSPHLATAHELTRWTRRSIVAAMALATAPLVFGQAESPMGRLQHAIKVSRELAAAAEALTAAEEEPVETLVKADRENIVPKRFPRGTQVVEYDKVRPWACKYGDRFSRNRAGEPPAAWPSAADGPALRGLLKAPDPLLRSLAAEALATLHLPEDLPSLASLLGDTAGATPVLGHNFRYSSRPILPVASNENRLTVERSWHQRTVATYARQGVKLITGREFADEAAFLEWWKPNENARHCLWYWQERLQREMDEAELVAGNATKATKAKAAIAKNLLAELKQMPPEVEAKVRLLTTRNQAGGAPITGEEAILWPDPPSLRLPANRLLDLLDRKEMWQDVVWDGKHYNLLAERLGIWADVFFLLEHANRLRSALQRERDGLWWSGQAALIIGISRLSPVATEEKLDQPETRDGTLRNAVVTESDAFVRDYCAMELVRVGLPGSAAFLHQAVFQPSKDKSLPSLPQAILQELAKKPLTNAKRELLIAILLDERFKANWTRPNNRMGDDMDRQYASAAVNAHAGSPLISDELKQALADDPARSIGALKRVLKCVQDLRRKGK